MGFYAITITNAQVRALIKVIERETDELVVSKPIFDAFFKCNYKGLRDNDFDCEIRFPSKRAAVIFMLRWL